MTAYAQGTALLFCPADRPERYAKALDRADAVIIDLEDAVAPASKAGARQALLASDLDPNRVIVRINPAGSSEHAADLAAVARTRYRHIMLAKAESAAHVLALPEELSVIALCETARGVAAAAELAACAQVSALMWGAEDLVADLGGTSSRHADGSYRDIARFARAAVLLAAGSHGVPAIDAVHIDIADVAGLERELEDAVASGFAATACIHPSQAPVIRRAYAPSAQAVAEARRLLDAAAHEGGVFTFEGRMIDEPILRHARAVLASANKLEGE